jgi:hypothetical protein
MTSSYGAPPGSGRCWKFLLLPEAVGDTISCIMGKMSLLKELLLFLKETKMWWLAPIFIILILLSIFIFLTEGSAVLPFIYTLF